MFVTQSEVDGEAAVFCTAEHEEQIHGPPDIKYLLKSVDLTTRVLPSSKACR